MKRSPEELVRISNEIQDVFAPFSKGYHAYGKDARCKCMMYPELPNHLMDVATEDNK